MYVSLAIALAWSVVICVLPAPERFLSLQIQASGLILATHTALMLATRPDLRGAAGLPVAIVLGLTLPLWSFVSGSIAAIVVEALIVSPTSPIRTDPLSIFASIGLVYLALIALINRSTITLLPMLIAIPLSLTLLALAPDQSYLTSHFGIASASLHMGIAFSLAMGLREIIAQARRIPQGRCVFCGYHTANILTGPCPECGKYRDEIPDPTT